MNVFAIHIIISIVFFLAILFCSSISISDNLKKDGIVYIPFYKLSVNIIRISHKFNKSTNSQDISIRKSLLMLNPGSTASELYKEFKIRLVGKICLFFFIGNMLGLGICYSELSAEPISDKGTIERNAYGLGEKSVAVDIYADGEEVITNENIIVSEQQYSEEEIEKQFQEISLIIENRILGKNKSLDYVCYDLELVDSIEGYPINIEWEIDNYSVISRSGEIQENHTVAEGTIIEIKAIMTYFDYENIHYFNAVIYPPPKTEKEKLINEIRKTIDVYDKETRMYSESFLPASINGREIVYKAHKSEISIYILVLIIIVVFIVYIERGNEISKQIKERDRQMMMDFPQIVSKLTLFIGAGMTIKAAFIKVATDYAKKKKKDSPIRYAYEEMLIGVRQLEGGISENEVYTSFGARCNIQRYVKFGALLAQNIKKGSVGLLEILENEEKDAFEDRKALAKKMGEEAGTKLLVPMCMMLLIVMVVIIIPAFLSFNG